MLLVNLVLISKRLKLTPLKFLRRDLSTSKKQKAVRLPDIRFFDRFRLRIILQNKSSYITLFVGIVFANILLLFFRTISGNPRQFNYRDESAGVCMSAH